MDSEENRLIEEIKAGLSNFEIPYEEGNWENFQKTYGGQLNRIGRKRRKMPAVVLWRYIAATAAVLIGVLVYVQWPRLEKDRIQREPITEQASIPSGNEELNPIPAVEDSGLQPAPVRQAPANARPVQSVLTSIHRVKSTPPVTKLNEEVPAPSGPAPTIPEKSVEEATARIEPPEEYEPASGRWKFGIELNSTLTTDRPGIAAGILTQFEVSDQIKLAAGLTYSRIAASHDIDPVQLSYDTRMVGGESVIRAIDIPLTLVYEPTDGWFASVGVSALAVLDEDKSYRMESEVLQETVMIDRESGASVAVFEVVTDQYSRPGVDTDFEGRSNLGYLNLSIGRKQRLNKRADLLFEPFIKIPMGGLQRRDVNMLTSGLKIKVLF